MLTTSAMALLLLVPSAFATVTTSISPAIVPTDGTVAISTCATGNEILQEILVTTPTGVVWALHPQTDVKLKASGFLCPTTYDKVFGNNSPGWCAISLVPVVIPPPTSPLPLWWRTTCLSGQTQTGDQGTYTVTWIWKSGPHGVEQFNVSKNFQVVPEFGVPAVLLTALGFAVLTKYKVRRTA